MTDDFEQDDQPEKHRVSLHNKLNDMFGLPAVQQPLEDDGHHLPAVTTPRDISDEERLIEQDFAETRDTLRELENTGKDVLEKFVEIARESESPRAIEVLGNFMKTLSEISINKASLHEKKKQIKSDKGSQQDGSPQLNIQNANIVVGTTADILARRRLDKQSTDE